jgi:hypothetical protein
LSWISVESSELIEASAQFQGIANPAIVETDYSVTEALHLIAQGYGSNET